MIHPRHSAKRAQTRRGSRHRGRFSNRRRRLPGLERFEDRTLLSVSFEPVVNSDVGLDPWGLGVGDFDGQNGPDLVTANEDTNDVSLLFNNGDGTFAEAVSIAVGTRPSAIAVGDFDGQNGPDIAVTNRDDDNVSVLLNEGDGTFGAATDFDVGDFPLAIATADLDGDDHLDLVTANSNNNNVSVLLGNGDGTFGAATEFDVGGFPEAVAIGDFDGVNGLDLAVTNRDDDNVSVLLNEGDGTFGAATDFDVGDFPWGVAAGDFNGDDNTDLVVSNAFDDNVSILLGNGDGSFADGGTFDVGDANFAVTVADLDGNDTLDIITTNRDSDDVAVLLGNGDGTFLEAAFFDVSDGPYPIVTADFNQDDLPDVASANRFGDNVSVLINVPLTLSIEDLAIPEGDSGATDAEFEVTLSFDPGQVVTVDFEVLPGTATPDVDYEPVSDTLTFDGTTTQTIAVPVIGDTDLEFDETFIVRLSNPSVADGSGITLLQDEVTGTILDDESEMSLGTDEVAVVEGDSATIAVTRDGLGALTREATAMITVEAAPGDAATAGEDFLPFSQTITFDPFESTKTISVLTFSDGLLETDETFSVLLSDITSAKPGEPLEALVTIEASSARFLPVEPNPRRDPVESIDLEFSEPIDPASLELADLSLTRNGSDVPLNGGLTITEVPAAASPTFRISGLENVTMFRGDYVLSLDFAEVSGETGGTGDGVVEASFTVRPEILKGDYDGDGVVDLAVYQFRDGTGRFLVRQSSRIGEIDEVRVFELGVEGAIPVVGDFDGDGLTDPAVADPNAIIGGGDTPNATVWTFLASGDGFSEVVVPFGAPGSLDRPAPGDFDGDGVTDFATLRPDSDLIPGAAEWFISRSTDGPLRVAFGAANGVDLPAVDDYDGDGVDDIAAFRPESDLVPGASQTFVLPSGPNLANDYEDRLDAFPVTFGDAFDQAVPADYNNDGRVDVAVFRPESNLAAGQDQWFILPSEGESPNFGGAFAVTFGDGGTIAAPGDYTGDLVPELGVFNSETNRWRIQSATNGDGTEPFTVIFGDEGVNDVPVLAPLSVRLAAVGALSTNTAGDFGAIANSRGGGFETTSLRGDFEDSTRPAARSRRLSLALWDAWDDTIDREPSSRGTSRQDLWARIVDRFLDDLGSEVPR